MKYLNLLASVVIQLCLGGLYAWSAFVPRLAAVHGVSVERSQLVFGVCIATFTGAMLLSGRMVERRGPRRVASLGGVLFGAGYLVAALSGGSFPLLLLGAGVLAGLGTGFGYACPLPTCMRWFPRHKGLVTGVAVAGFGGGAVVLVALAHRLLAGGRDVLEVLGWIGVVYGFVILAAAQPMKFPKPPAAAAAAEQPRLRDLVRDPFFVLLVVGIFSGTFAGLLVIGNLEPLGTWAGLSPTAASWTVSIFAAGNVIGRIAWGRVADRLGRNSVPVSLAFLAVSLVLLAVSATRWPAVVAGSAFLVGLGFGSCFVVYAAQAAARYGNGRFGRVYPLVFLAYGAAAIAGPWSGGWLYGRAGGYAASLWMGVAVVVVGLLACTRLLRGVAASRGIAENPSLPRRASDRRSDATA